MRPVVAADKTSLSAPQGTRASLDMRGSRGELRTCLAFDNYPLSTAQISGRQSISLVRRRPPVLIRPLTPSVFQGEAAHKKAGGGISCTQQGLVSLPEDHLRT